MKIAYEIVDDFDHVFDERDNVFIAFRKIIWGENGDPDKAKLDMRRWGIDADGNESPHKGFSFLTEDGPNELSRMLVEIGYGNTGEILHELNKRDDFESCLNEVVGEDSEFYSKDAVDEDYYDPSSTTEMFDYADEKK